MSDRGVREALAARSGTAPQDWFLVLKARSGLEVVFRVLRAVRGAGSVVTQVFTCATAVDPVLVAGLVPRYAEVHADSLALDPDRLDLPADVRAVVVQHTFGMVDDAAALRLRDAAHAGGAVLVEDSAHAVTRLARAAGAPVADVSVHSFGAEKLLATKFGGAVWVRPDLDPAVRGPLVAALAALPVPGLRHRWAMRCYRGQLRVLTRLPAAVAGPVRALATRVGLHEPPVAPVERTGRLAHPPLRPSRWVLGTMARALAWSGAVQARRAETAAVYARELADLDVPAGARGHAPLVRFPLYAPDTAAAERVLAGLAAAGVPAGRWYRPALFPGPTDPALYAYRPGEVPTTEDLIARVVNLPTTVAPVEAERIAGLVRGLIDPGARPGT